MSVAAPQQIRMPDVRAQLVALIKADLDTADTALAALNPCEVRTTRGGGERERAARAEQAAALRGGCLALRCRCRSLL